MRFVCQVAGFDRGCPQGREPIPGCMGTYDSLELQTDSTSWKSLESLKEFTLSLQLLYLSCKLSHSVLTFS